MEQPETIDVIDERECAEDNELKRIEKNLCRTQKHNSAINGYG